MPADHHPELTPCPCGAPAVWYHVTLWPVPDEEEIVKVLRIDDTYDDLCDECFQGWVAEGRRDGWMNKHAGTARHEKGST